MERKPQRQQERRRQGGWALPAQDRTSIYIDDLAGHEVGQVRSNEENRAGNFLGGGSAAEGNDSRSHLLARFRLEHGNGHVGGDPAGSDGVHKNIVTGKFGGEAFGEADDAAFGCAVVGVKGFAALAGGGADRDDFAVLFLYHRRNRDVYALTKAANSDSNHEIGR